jgi:hypothetical protein
MVVAVIPPIIQIIRIIPLLQVATQGVTVGVGEIAAVAMVAGAAAEINS